MIDKMAVFGDVHGRSDMLKGLHKKIKHFHGDIPLKSCGDLVDRGPDSAGVVQYCIDNYIDVVIGNHDDWLRRLCVDLEFEPFSMTTIMGGVYTAQSYGAVLAGDKQHSDADIGYELYSQIPQEHKDWLKEQPLYRKFTLSTGEIYWILHAGVTNGAAHSFYDQSVDDEGIMSHFIKYRRARDLLLWARPKFPYSNKKKGRIKRVGDEQADNLYHFRDDATQIFGHTIRNEVIMDDHYIACDTGCGTKKHGQKLSVVILPEREVISITDDDLQEWLDK
jgi:hypothetical protein